MATPVKIVRPIGDKFNAYAAWTNKFPLWFYDPIGKAPLHLYAGTQFQMDTTPDCKSDELGKVIHTECGTTLNELSGEVVAAGFVPLSGQYRGRHVCAKCYILFKRWYRKNVIRKERVRKEAWDAEVQKVREADGAAWFDL